MYQLQWLDRVFSISYNVVRSINELALNYKIKKKTDGSSSTVLITGHELQKFPIEYNVSRFTGIDPLKEYTILKSYLAKYGPLLLEGTLLGPNNTILTKVALRSEHISNDGIILDGTISLEFVEFSTQGKSYAANAAKYKSPIIRPYFKDEPLAVEDLMLKVLYNGTDISDAISVNSCIHEMFASSEADTLVLKFNDINKLWDKWQPQKNEMISIVCGIAKSGQMFIHSVDPENGLYTLRASSVPRDADKKNEKSWENVWLLQLVKEIADRHELGFEYYGVEDRLYSYICQENLPDFEFLQETCDLESLAFVVYDKKLVLYSEEYLENQEAIKTIEIDDNNKYNYSDNSLKGLGGLTIKNGNISGAYFSSNGLTNTDTRIINHYLSSASEANRFAKGIWRKESKKLATGVLKDTIMRDISAGSIFNLVTSGASSWDEKVLVYKIRQDYVEATSKLFFRKAQIG